MRVLVTGGREYWDYQKILNALVEFGGKDAIEVVIHGDARGADTLAKKAAKALGIPHLPFPIPKEDWKIHGKFAGSMRNQKMIDEGNPDLVLAFPDPNSRGTWDMVYRAKANGIPVKVFQP